MSLFKRVTVEEIHETFNTEVDRLLAESIKEPTPRHEEVVDKSQRLKRFGFKRVEDVVRGEEELARRKKKEAENAMKQEVKEAIRYFQHKYPHYKFITEDSVKRICEKYGLIYGSVDKFKGFVPEKNLAEMERFHISEDDGCYEKYYSHMILGSVHRGDTTYIPKSEYDRYLSSRTDRDYVGRSTTIYQKCSLEIAAPEKDFDTTGMKVRDKKLSQVPPPDPVVLQPVHFNGRKHYLIMTAWGDESSDELVLNERHN